MRKELRFRLMLVQSDHYADYNIVNYEIRIFLPRHKSLFGVIESMIHETLHHALFTSANTNNKQEHYAINYILMECLTFE